METTNVIYPVATVADAYDACHPDTPLEDVNDSRYVDMTAVRGGESLVKSIAFAIERTRSPNFHQQLVTGHRGCGKSTEFFQLKARLETHGYFVVYLDVGETLDLGDISYLDILIGIAKAIVGELEAAGIDLNENLLKEVLAWLTDKTIIEERNTESEGKIGASFKLSASIPFLSKALAETTGHIKSGSKRREEIRTSLERELSLLIELLNILIDDARTRLRSQGFRDLVVIVDQLEKMAYRTNKDGISNHTELFVHHAGQLKSLHCHILYTVPINLIFIVALGNLFNDIFVIPMVDTNKTLGREKLHEVVARRVDIEKVFASPELVDRLIEMSGGAVRDLMRLVRLACQNTDETITAADVDRAIRALIREYDRLVKEDYIPLLKKVNESKRVDGSFADLLGLRVIHEYQNGDRWADLHPAVRAIPWIGRALNPPAIL
ncbi:MAG: AAA family ATPase [Proteobacteria bacterium]|nr:AAA family ATPase [Pseudomonadota bacterium]